MRALAALALCALSACTFPNGTAACLDLCAARAACGVDEPEQNCLTGCIGYVEWAGERGKRCSRNVREEVRCLADLPSDEEGCELLLGGEFRDGEPCFRAVAQSTARCGEFDGF